MTASGHPGDLGLLPQAFPEGEITDARDMDEQMKELMAIGASVAANCYPPPALATMTRGYFRL